jgi:hypothetical protein
MQLLPAGLAEAAENTKKRVGKNKHGGTEKMEKYKIQLFPADLAEAAENTKKRVGKNKHGGTEKMEKYKIQLFPADLAEAAENTKKKWVEKINTEARRKWRNTKCNYFPQISQKPAENTKGN